MGQYSLDLFTHERDINKQPPSPQERLAWLRLIRTDSIGPVTFYQLLKRYGSASAALHQLPELARKGGRKKPLVAYNQSRAEDELAQIKRAGGHLLTPLDPAYPLGLAEISDAPPVITVLGRLDLLNKPTLAIVGARNASLNGQNFTRKIAKAMGDNGLTIASGLARGIDTCVHEASIESGTIAVVAGGADNIYPKENTKLYHAIIEQGALIAESPWGTEPLARHFPKRNRIISGLSLGTLVVEATKKSGSLITARYAAEQGRDVFAVPGFPGDPRAQGPNSLLRDGAVLVEHVDDILDVLNNFKNTQPRRELSEVQHPIESQDINNEIDSPTRQDIHDHLVMNLSYSPVTVDELLRTCQFNIADVQMILLELELGGRITRHAGNRISLLE